MAKEYIQSKKLKLSFLLPHRCLGVARWQHGEWSSKQHSRRTALSPVAPSGGHSPVLTIMTSVTKAILSETTKQSRLLSSVEKMCIDLFEADADASNNMFCAQSNQKAYENDLSADQVSWRNLTGIWMRSSQAKWESLAGYSKRDGPVVCTRTVCA